MFDEVDAGIGGAAAESVGRRLKALAARDQVLCVTHLAQIAGFGDHHFAVEKHESQGRTTRGRPGTRRGSSYTRNKPDVVRPPYAGILEARRAATARRRFGLTRSPG